jgi:hypothetical protein
MTLPLTWPAAARAWSAASSESGLTYQAGLLERRGLVARSRSPDDERSVTVTITAAGTSGRFYASGSGRISMPYFGALTTASRNRS